MGNIGYGKIGRTISLTPAGWGTVGGDNEPPRMLDLLARRHPEHRFIILSQCDDDPVTCGLPPNVVNTWTPERRQWLREQTRRVKDTTEPNSFESAAGLTDVMTTLLEPLAEKLDGMLLWVGQHGTANSILPAVTSRTRVAGLTRPYDSFNLYVGGFLKILNSWREVDPLRREEIWLIADNRNYLKMRDAKWPQREPVLGQYTFTRSNHHERFGDRRDPVDVGFPDSRWGTDHTWKSPVRYEYSRLEIGGILPDHLDPGYDEDWENRRRFGLFINEAGTTGKIKRRDVVAEWVLPVRPDFIHGSWTAGSLRTLEIDIQPVAWDAYYPLLTSVRCTFTTPSSGSGWATTKPWEAFAAGTVCFFHPAYDDQNNILGDAPDWLRGWLRVQTPEDLRARIHALSQDRAAWLAIIREQRAHYDRAVAELRHIKMIEERMARW